LGTFKHFYHSAAPWHDLWLRILEAKWVHLLGSICYPLHAATSRKVQAVALYRLSLSAFIKPQSSKKKKKKWAWKVNTVSITHMSMKANIRRISSHFELIAETLTSIYINCFFFFFFKVLNSREKNNPKEKPIYVY
jgi:hypothetical protein